MFIIFQKLNFQRGIKITPTTIDRYEMVGGHPSKMLTHTPRFQVKHCMMLTITEVTFSLIDLVVFEKDLYAKKLNYMK